MEPQHTGSIPNRELSETGTTVCGSVGAELQPHQLRAARWSKSAGAMAPLRVSETIVILARGCASLGSMMSVSGSCGTSSFGAWAGAGFQQLLRAARSSKSSTAMAPLRSRVRAIRSRAAPPRRPLPCNVGSVPRRESGACHRVFTYILVPRSSVWVGGLGGCRRRMYVMGGARTYFDSSTLVPRRSRWTRLAP